MGDETETVLLHLGYVSSYDSYLFCVLMTSDPDLPVSKFQLNFPLMEKPGSANTKTLKRSCYCSGKSVIHVQLTKFAL